MQHVVGAAILRGGCVLAARRTSPPSAAGRWEFPGGKVEPEESPGDALVREISEELGCVIEVTGWLTAEVIIGTTHSLTVATAQIVTGDPQPTEHDALRWLGAEQIDEVDWLDSDRPFLSQLLELLEDHADTGDWSR
jgi:8-oxo-dGTP diphosphatase